MPQLIAFFKKHQYLTAFLIFLVFWFLIFIVSGSLFSGYHFTDDHELVTFHHRLKDTNIFELMLQWFRKDHDLGRFRPFYYVHRIIQAQILGFNLLIWSIYTGLFAVFTTFFLFVFARLIQFSFLEALLFGLLTTVGPQAAIWWQLGPAETIGMLLFSATLLLAVRSTQPGKYRVLYEVLFIAVALLTSLSKESFVMMLPAIAFTKVWVFQKLRSVSWRQACLANVIPLGILGITFGLETWFIKAVVGANSQVGSSSLERLNLPNLLNTAAQLNEFGPGWLLFVSLVLAILAHGDRNHLSWRTFAHSIIPTLKDLSAPIILSSLIICSQAVLYTLSSYGISQRYLLPGILGYAWLIVWLYRYVKLRWPDLSKVILFLIALSLAIKLSLVWGAVRVYAREGESTTALLRSIEAQTTATDKIALITHPRAYLEWNFSIKQYLTHISDRRNLYLGTYSAQETSYYQELLGVYEQKALDTLSDKRDLQCIIVFPELNRAFLKRSHDWFVEDQYQLTVFENFNRNLNEDSTIHLYCKKPIS